MLGNVRSLGLTLMTMTALALAACGPGRVSTLEGFGETSEDDPSADGPTNPDLGGGGECIAADFGAAPTFEYAAFLDDSYGDDFDDICGDVDGPDLGVRWVAPSSQLYRASMFSEAGSTLALLEGQDCDGPLIACDALSWPAELQFEATAGQSYVFMIDANGSDDYVELFVEPVGSGGGQCPHEVVDSAPTEIEGTTIDGTFQFGSPCGGENAPERTILFIPPFDGEYWLSTVGSDFDTVLYVHDGECGGPLIECNDDSNGLHSELLLELEGGRPYTVVVDGFGEQAGFYQLYVEPTGEPPPPPDPVCEDADLLPSETSVALSWPSLEDSGDLNQLCSALGAERRFRWVAPETGEYVFASDGNNPAALSVFPQGCPGDWLCAAGAMDPELTTFVEAGQEVFVVVDWEPEFGGAMELTIDPEGVIVPGCGEPLPEGVPTQVAGTTGNAGDDYMGQCASNPTPEREYWWAAPATGNYRISLEGSAYDTLLYVRDGGCDGPELGCNDDTVTMFGIELWSSLELELEAGQTISIFVDGYSGSGSFELAITEL